MAYYGPGNWKIGKLRLPELGLSEKLGGKKQSLSDATVRKNTGKEPTVSIDVTKKTVSTPKTAPLSTPVPTQSKSSSKSSSKKKSSSSSNKKKSSNPIVQNVYAADQSSEPMQTPVPQGYQPGLSGNTAMYTPRDYIGEALSLTPYGRRPTTSQNGQALPNLGGLSSIYDQIDKGAPEVLGANTQADSGMTGNTGAYSPATSLSYPDLMSLLNAQFGANLSELNTGYGKEADLLSNEITGAKGDLATGLSENDQAAKDLGKETTAQRTLAEQQTADAKQAALETAQATTRANRGVLRALGIVDSTAGGELLTQPMNEFSKTSAGLDTQLVNRYNEIENYKATELGKLNLRARQLKDNYKKIKENIQTSLSYNQKEKNDAIKALNAAMLQQIASIKQDAYTVNTNASTAQDTIVSKVPRVAQTLTGNIK